MNQKSLQAKVLHHEIDRDAVTKKIQRDEFHKFDALYLIMTCLIHTNFHLSLQFLSLYF